MAAAPHTSPCAPDARHAWRLRPGARGVPVLDGSAWCTPAEGRTLWARTAGLKRPAASLLANRAAGGGRAGLEATAYRLLSLPGHGRGRGAETARVFGKQHASGNVTDESAARWSTFTHLLTPRDDAAEEMALDFVRCNGVRHVEGVLDLLYAQLSQLQADVQRAQGGRTATHDRREAMLGRWERKAERLHTLCSSLMALIRELVPNVSNVCVLSHHYLASTAFLASILRFLRFPGVALVAALVVAEVLADTEKCPYVTDFAAHGVDVLRLLLDMAPPEFVACTNLLAAMVFDPVAQDPGGPSNARRMLRRARSAAAFYAERVLPAAPTAAAATATAGNRQRWRDAAVGGHASWLRGDARDVIAHNIMITPEVDENHAALVLAAEGELVYRLLTLLMSPPPSALVSEVLTLMQQSDMGGLTHTEVMQWLMAPTTTGTTTAQRMQVLNDIMAPMPALVEWIGSVAEDAAAAGAASEAGGTAADASAPSMLRSPLAYATNLLSAMTGSAVQSLRDIMHGEDASDDDAAAVGASARAGDAAPGSGGTAPGSASAPAAASASACAHASDDAADASTVAARFACAASAALHTTASPAASRDGWADVTPLPGDDDSHIMARRHMLLARLNEHQTVVASAASKEVRAQLPTIAQDYALTAVSTFTRVRWHQLERSLAPHTVLGRHSLAASVQPVLFSQHDVHKYCFDSHAYGCLAAAAAADADAAVVPGAGASGARPHRVLTSVEKRSLSSPTVHDILLHTVQQQRPDVAFVLASIMAGPRRRQLQDFLAACGMLPAMLNLLVKANWTFDPALSPPSRIHGPTCECRPETAGTIQLLRLLYSTIDRDCDSPVQRWLPRRRHITTSELHRMFTHYAQPQDIRSYRAAASVPWVAPFLHLLFERADDAAVDAAAGADAVDGERDGDGDTAPHLLQRLDESSLLTLMLTPAAYRPWGVVTAPAHEAPRDALAQLVWAGTVTDAGVLTPASTLPPVPRARALRVTDPILYGLNSLCSRDAQHPAPAASRAAAGELNVKLLADHIAEAAVNTPELTALKKKAPTFAEEEWCPELAHRPRGAISLLLQALVRSKPRAPYRAWLSSCLETFLRGSPTPARRWVNAHGLVRFVVHTLLTDVAMQVVRSHNGMEDASDRARREEVRGRAAAAADAAGGAYGHGSHARRHSHAAGGSASSEAHADDDSVEEDTSEEDVLQRYSLQSMFDLLGECMMHNREGMAHLLVCDAEWTARELACLANAQQAGSSNSLGDAPCARVPDMHGAWSVADTAAGVADAPASVSEWSRRALSGLTLLRLAFDRMQDANVMVRTLLMSEDAAHGMPAACASVRGAGDARLPACPPTVSCALLQHPNSWLSLRKRTARAILSGAGASAAVVADADAVVEAANYEVIDFGLLATPHMWVLLHFRVPLLYRMMSAVSLAALTQDNVSTINTAILQFMVAHRHGALPGLVAALREYEAALPKDPVACAAELRRSLPSLEDNVVGMRPAAPTEAAPQRPGQNAQDGVIAEFGRTLVFWLEYYCLRERDRRVLRISNRYAYPHMRVVVRALLGLPIDTPITAARCVASQGSMDVLGSHYLFPAPSSEARASCASSEVAVTEAARVDDATLHSWLHVVAPPALQTPEYLAAYWASSVLV